MVIEALAPNHIDAVAGFVALRFHSDPGHGPARAAYERAGFGLVPVARYFKQL